MQRPGRSRGQPGVSWFGRSVALAAAHLQPGYAGCADASCSALTGGAFGGFRGPLQACEPEPGLASPPTIWWAFHGPPPARCARASRSCAASATSLNTMMGTCRAPCRLCGKDWRDAAGHHYTAETSAWVTCSCVKHGPDWAQRASSHTSSSESVLWYRCPESDLVSSYVACTQPHARVCCWLQVWQWPWICL